MTFVGLICWIHFTSKLHNKMNLPKMIVKTITSISAQTVRMCPIWDYERHMPDFASRHLCKIQTHLNWAIIIVYLPWYLTLTLILNTIDQQSGYFTNIAFWNPNSALTCASHKRSDACITDLLCHAHGMSNKQFVYDNRTVFVFLLTFCF